jgi:glycogen phosphorylase
VARVKAETYRPWEIYHRQEELRAVLDLIGSGLFSHGDGNLFRPVIDHLLSRDDYLLLADYASYIACQDAVSRTYGEERIWTRMSILNVARMGKFSSDRTIAEYCRDIWDGPEDARPASLSPVMKSRRFKASRMFSRL